MFTWKSFRNHLIKETTTIILIITYFSYNCMKIFLSLGWSKRRWKSWVKSLSLLILVTRASDLLAAHDPRLWETMQHFSQNLAIWTLWLPLLEQTGNYQMASLLKKVLDFALTKAGKDSNWKLSKSQLLKLSFVKKRDVLKVLPLGFAKSLVFHLLSEI